MSLTETATAKDVRTQVHVLPCRIHYDGTADVSDYFVVEKKQVHGSLKTFSTFRGRRLFGKRLEFPVGYHGYFYKEHSSKHDDDRAFLSSYSCDHLMVWEHDEEPALDHHTLGKAIEWLKIADKLHAVDE